MGITKEKYLQFLKEKDCFLDLAIKFYDKERDFKNNIIKIIIKYIKSLHPNIKHFRKDTIVDISYNEKDIFFSVDSNYGNKISVILGANFKRFKMPIKYLNPKELEELKMQKKLELL
jgi:hypothetical protein